LRLKDWRELQNCRPGTNHLVSLIALQRLERIAKLQAWHQSSVNNHLERKASQFQAYPATRRALPLLTKDDAGAYAEQPQKERG
jgi:hypothetical protein